MELIQLCEPYWHQYAQFPDDNRVPFPDRCGMTHYSVFLQIPRFQL